MQNIIEPAGPAASEISALVEFHNARGLPRDSVCVFDCRALPEKLAVSFRLTKGASVRNPQNATARALRADEARAPAGFDTTVYEVTPKKLGRVSVPLGPFQMIRAFITVRKTGPVPAGARYRFEVQQYGPRFDPASNTLNMKELSLIGGSTFVIPIASGPPAPISPRPFEPEHHEDESALLWMPPWLRDAAVERRRELISRSGGPYATAVFVRNDKPKYTGTCPVTVNFTAEIKVGGTPGILSYLWLRSDGAMGRVQQVTVRPGDRSVKVKTNWTFGIPGKRYDGWQALRVLGPPVLTSARSHFSVACSK